MKVSGNRWLLVLGALLLSHGLAPSALALAAKPVGYVERGRIESVDGQAGFVSDSESGLSGGRFLSINDPTPRVFYGVGAHPVLDLWWPAYSANAALEHLLSTSAGGLSHLERYQAAARHSEGFARLGWLGFLAGTAGVVGALIYNALPANPREVQPVFLYTALGAMAVGGTMFVSATLGGMAQEPLLDEAIAAYNKELIVRAGKARTTL